MRPIFPYNYKFFCKFFVLDLLMLTIARGLFLYKFSADLTHLPWQELSQAFLIGAQLDSSLLAYLFAPFFLLGILPFLGVEFSQISRSLFGYLLAICFLIIFALTLVDIEFFGVYNSHLNLTSIEYLNDNLGVLWEMIYSDFPVVWYALAFLLVSALYLYLAHLIIKVKPQKTKLSVLNLGKRFFFFIILAGGLFVAARGSLGNSQVNWGKAFFSKNNLVNQLALNPIFNLYRNIYYSQKIAKENLNEKIRYFKTNQAAIEYAQKKIAPGNFLNSSYPFYKKVTAHGTQKDLNVVLIILEEFCAEFTGATGFNKNLTPNFDALAKKGLLCTQFFSCGQRTNKGISATLCSWPPLVGKSMMEQTEGQQKISTLASVLKSKNYQTWFCHGGELQYDNMQGFLINKGFDNFVGRQSFNHQDFLNKWGVPDELVLNKMIEIADTAFAQNTPFLLAMMSLTNHPPYTVPDYRFGQVMHGGELQSNYNTFKYVDWCIGQFMSKMRKKPYFKNTLFVFVGDHSKTLHRDLPFDYRKSFVPALFYAPHHISSGKIEHLSNQMDITPTILGILNMSYEASFWGKDLRKKSSAEDYAFIVRNSKFGYLQGDYYLTGDFGSEKSELYRLWTNQKVADEKILQNNLLKKVYAIEQSAYTLYKQRRITP